MALLMGVGAEGQSPSGCLLPLPFSGLHLLAESPQAVLFFFSLRLSEAGSALWGHQVEVCSGSQPCLHPGLTT